MMFNLAQLATWQQARDLVEQIKGSPYANMGGGVRPESTNNDNSGIYIPSWDPGPEAFPIPHYDDPETGEKYLFLHLRFQSGVEGVNVGLVLDKMKRYPMSPYYVLGTVAAEVNSMRP